MSKSYSPIELNALRSKESLSDEQPYEFEEEERRNNNKIILKTLLTINPNLGFLTEHLPTTSKSKIKETVELKSREPLSPFENAMIRNLEKLDKNITQLDFSGEKISINDKILKYVTQKFTKLTDLDLAGNVDITSEGLKNIRNLKNLKSLDLSNCLNLDIQTLIHLRDLKLEKLNLNGCNQINNDWIAILCRMKSIKSLGLSDCCLIGYKDINNLLIYSNITTLCLEGCGRLNEEHQAIFSKEYGELDNGVVVKNLLELERATNDLYKSSDLLDKLGIDTAADLKEPKVIDENDRKTQENVALDTLTPKPSFVPQETFKLTPQNNGIKCQ